VTIDIDTDPNALGLRILTDTVVDGGGLITLDAGHRGGVFWVSGGINGRTLTLQNLTIANGNAKLNNGGAIIFENSLGVLTVTDSTFSGNSASTDGGAIAIYNNRVALTFTNCTFSDNSAVRNGGAIYMSSASPLTITNSTFSGNRAGDNGGYGGAIRSANTTVTNCTFSGNRAGIGGGISNANRDNLSIAITNTIIANSTLGGNCDSIVGAEGGHNLDSDGTCNFGPATDPKLAPVLGDNGGPTKTFALLVGSPAINAGDQAICTTAPVNNRDQRGYVRPGGGASSCSIGAFEANADSPPGACVGDCSNDGQVTVNEIFTLVGMALGTAPPSACPLGVPDRGEVDIAMIVRGVNSARGTACQ